MQTAIAVILIVLGYLLVGFLCSCAALTYSRVHDDPDFTVRDAENIGPMLMLTWAIFLPCAFVYICHAHLQERVVQKFVEWYKSNG